MPRGPKKKGKVGYMISAVAEMFTIHPQTLRLYEREGLLVPSRSEGNTRLYTQEDLDRLALILNLTREMGVNLAGIEVILTLRRRIEEMEKEMQAFVEFVREQIRGRIEEVPENIQNALVRVGTPHLIRKPPAK